MDESNVTERACSRCGIVKPLHFRSFRKVYGRYLSSCLACSNKPPSDEERFWAKVDKNGPTPEHVPELGPCWIWTRGRKKFGYGTVIFNKRNLVAHRVSWFLRHGRWPEPCALHKCDNPSCVNPDHLFEGTKGDNNLDRDRKGRTVRVRCLGEAHGQAVLTEAAVREIRAAAVAGEHPRSIARRHGVHYYTIKAVLWGRTWKHVT
jgi:hypothetical protein